MRALVLLTLPFLGACIDADPPALRTLVTVIATQDGQPVEDATVRLVGYGRRSLVILEAALHTAEPSGRRRLLRAMRRLGDEEAAPLLRHVARYDEDEAVRGEARAILVGWADGPPTSRAAAARKALDALPVAPAP